MTTLCTFSGCNGDILWSLPTVRQIARRGSGQVDFAIMPQYRKLLPLLEHQEYIAKAFVIEEWICTGSPHGDQPWEAPRQEGYDETIHLTYRQHPGMGCPSIPLCDFIAWQQKLHLTPPVVPFLSVPRLGSVPALEDRPIAYAFNPLYAEHKKAFFDELKYKLAMSESWIDTTRLPFVEAAQVMQAAGLFVGCRSSNWVIAMGLGVQTITFEPHPGRHETGPFGKVFGCPHGKEMALSQSPQIAAQQAAQAIQIARKAESVQCS